MKSLKLVNELTRAYKQSVLELLEKLDVGTGGTYKASKSGKRTYRARAEKPQKNKKSIRLESSGKGKEKERYSGQRMFIESLKAIGRPAMTWEIMDRFKKMHPELKLPKDKKLVMHRFYNSASILSKEGVVKRTPVGKKSYEYSLAS